MYKLFKKTTTVAISFFFSLTSIAQSSIKDSVTKIDVYAGIEFSMPKVKETSFPNYEVDITQFGAIGDGVYKNTAAFAKAIAAVTQHGGGKVKIPQGIWLSGPITLKSNVNIHLEQGAILLFSRDFSDYPLQKGNFEGAETYRCVSPINANGATNIAITGNGIVDGNGDAWRPVKKMKMTDTQWSELVKSGGVLSRDGKMWFPTAGALKGHENGAKIDFSNNNDELQSIKDYLRPVMVSLVNCKQVLLDGPTFQNSPAWNIHPLLSEDIIVRNLTIKNPWYSQNGDGLDIESCKNVLVYNTSFDVGDDAICIKSGKDKEGRARNIPTENVIVKNNIVYHAHGGFVVGSEMSGGVKNVHVSNCSFIGTDTGLRFKSNRGRGGVVENIYISNIKMTNIPTEAIRFNLFYGGNAPDFEAIKNGESSTSTDQITYSVTEETPSFRNIFMNIITVSGAKKAAFFMGLPEMNLKNIQLKNTTIHAENGIEIIDSQGLQFSNVSVVTPSKTALTIYNSSNLKFESYLIDEKKQAQIQVLGVKSKNIQFSKKDLTSFQTAIITGNDVNKKEITLK
ncbi:glycoside hydrolase family 28 protein [Flavobacterium agrisoli]|uniref:Glycoside hydrolase family 28 protein n=1 Tax=Flavobacterium agrisoli TaxID=2793066 RepID=A0A934PNU4_9FLAO|nr:glycoside hydrolase family 28 protein [Flavobacterium agrisoli]MBK0370204.1 glycoside hydrolase family 28 protein [Flavobacterium agrisoli]